MSTTIYRWNNQTEAYDRVAVLHDDASVTGDSPIATKLRDIIYIIEDEGGDPLEYLDGIQSRLIRYWDTGHYRVTWE